MEKRPKKQFNKPEREKSEFDQKVIELSRVTRVVKGGKRMRFRALVVIGDRKGRVGIGLRKGADVQESVNKAIAAAKKSLITLPLVDGTIPHEVRIKFKASKMFLKPARSGAGVKAGGAIRGCLELAGVKDVTGKLLGSNNKVNNVKAVFQALKSLRSRQDLKRI